MHLSGGGIVGKFGEDILFPMEYSAVLDSLYDPPQIMYDCMRWSGMSQREAYRTWNGGQGFLLVVRPSQAATLLALAQEAEVPAKVVGRILKESQPRLVIHSRFGGGIIEYFPEQKD